jgi:hypothetical protein
VNVGFGREIFQKAAAQKASEKEKGKQHEARTWGDAMDWVGRERVQLRTLALMALLR